MTDNLRNLFYARSIAIVGASPNQGYGLSMLKSLERNGYTGNIYPVNPTYNEVAGRPCFRSLLDVPEDKIDYAILAVRNILILPALEQCAQKGVSAVNIISSGYGEMTTDEQTGKQRQAELRAFVQRTGVRIIGPNCLGIVSVPNAMSATSYSFRQLIPGKIALVLQSGMLLATFMNTLHDRQIGFTYVVTSGNEADLTAVDYMRFYVEDEQTQVIGAFIEQIRDPAGFVEVAERAAALRKPIVVLKIGRTEAGRRAARAHTGSLAGSDEITDAVMRKYGVIRVTTLEEMQETLAIFHTTKLPTSTGAGALMTSGGATGLMTDLGNLMGIWYPPLSPESVARMQAVMPEYGAVSNPLDYTGQAWMQMEIIETALDVLGAEPDISVIAYARERPGNMDAADRTSQALAHVMAKYPDKIFVILAVVPGAHHDSLYIDTALQQPTAHLGEIPHLQGMENGLRAIRSLLWYGQFQRERAKRGNEGGETSVNGERNAAQQARAIIQSAGRRALTEAEGKAILSLYGIPVTREATATSAVEAAQQAREIGFPVALKILSPQITHKTEAGGVVLNIRSEEEARAAFERITASAKAYNPQAELQGVLVQEMAQGGYETIIGMTSDAQFGPAVLFGLGGIFVEVLKDSALRIPPLSRGEAREMIDALKGKAILQGARGARPADLAALVDVLVNFSRLCLDLKDDISEIDINPLIVFAEGRGAKAVDCLIVPKT